VRWIEREGKREKEREGQGEREPREQMKNEKNESALEGISPPKEVMAANLNAMITSSDDFVQ